MINIFSDPHLGVLRSSHTNKASRQLLSHEIFKKSVECIDPDLPNLIAGDLFDKDCNSESTISDAVTLCKYVSLVLGGNHDLPNRQGAVSSLELIDQAMGEDSPIVLAEVGTVKVVPIELNGVRVVAVPHHSSQGQFDKALEQCMQTGGDLLVLHCNVDNGFAEGDDAALNVSTETLKALLGAFKHIAIGHEHHSRLILDGRVCILGNTFPTSFGDISDKFTWRYSPDTGFTPNQVWYRDWGYTEIRIDPESPLAPDCCPMGVQFIDLTGTALPEQGPEVAQFITQLWEHNPNLLMLRNQIEYSTSAFDLAGAVSTPQEVLGDLGSLVSSDLVDSDLIELWKHYKAEVGA